MPSIRLSIRDRAILELNASPPTGIPQATKRRWTQQDSDTPLIGIFFVEEQPEKRVGRVIRRPLLLAAQCVISTVNPEQADDTVEPLLEHVVATLGESKLNGLVHELNERRTLWEPVVLDRFYLAATVIFEVKFQTLTNDLTRKQ